MYNIIHQFHNPFTQIKYAPYIDYLVKCRILYLVFHWFSSIAANIPPRNLPHVFLVYEYQLHASINPQKYTQPATFAPINIHTMSHIMAYIYFLCINEIATHSINDLHYLSFFVSHYQNCNKYSQLVYIGSCYV